MPKRSTERKPLLNIQESRFLPAPTAPPHVTNPRPPPNPFARPAQSGPVARDRSREFLPTAAAVQTQQDDQQQSRSSSSEEFDPESSRRQSRTPTPLPPRPYPLAAKKCIPP